MVFPRLSPLFVIPVVAVLLAAAYAVVWYFTAGVAVSAVERWLAARQAEGFTVQGAKPETGGFPGIVTITLDKPGLTAPKDFRGRPGWSWQGESVTVTVAPWAPRDLTVSLDGLQNVTLQDGRRLQLRGTPLQAQVHLDSGGFDEAQLNLAAVTATETAAGTTFAYTLDSLTGRLTRLAFEGVAAAETPTWRLTLKGQALNLPRNANLVLGPQVATLALSARLLGPLPEDTLSAGKPGIALDDWRQAGGTVVVDSLLLDWPPLRTVASGTLALDEAMQPEAAMSAQFQGFFETVDSLAAKGLIRSRDASMARVVLGLVARRPEGGGPPVLKAPVTVQNRILSVGPLPLIELPPVDWNYHLQRNPGDVRPGIQINPDGSVTQ